MKFLKVLALIIFFSIFISASKAEASSYTQEFSSTYLVKEDLVTYVTYRDVFVNNSETEVLDSYKVTIPFGDARDIVIKVNGAGVTTQYNALDDKIEAHIKFPSIVKGQTAIIDTAFTTTKVAKNFGGMTSVLIPAVGEGINVNSQTLSIPVALGELSSSSIESTINTDQSLNTFNFSSTQNVYMTFGRSFIFNFHLNQSLTNNTDKKATTNFLVPFENEEQSLFFYPADLESIFLIDDLGNAQINFSLDKGESKNIELSGVIQFSQKEIATSPTDTKVSEIYTKFINDSSPVNLNDIQYSDNLSKLFNEAGIISQVVVGRNNGTEMFGYPNKLNTWIIYYDEGNKLWRSLDPYFADLNNLGTKSFFNPDRIVFFVKEGEAVEEKNYFEFSKYEHDEKLLNEDLQYELFADPLEEVSLNVQFPLSVKLTNNSSKAIRIKAVSSSNKELKLKHTNKNMWVLPGQSTKYQVDGLLVEGIIGKRAKAFDLLFEIETPDKKVQNHIENIEVMALPTIRTFLPLLGIVTVILLSGGIFYVSKSRIKLTRKV